MRVMFLCLAGILLLNVAVLNAAGSARRAVVTKPVVNMYSTASLDADVVSQAILGTNVEVLEAKQGWWQIRTPDQYTGWAQADGFQETDKLYASSGSVAEVRNLFAHIYRERSLTRHQPVMTAPFETRLELGTVQDERWIEVVLPDSRTGYVQRGDVRLNPSPLSVSAMLETSKRFLGLPYTWGGTSSFGYDCSGFTQMLERRRGILMPRDAHVQAGWEGVVLVERDALEPGDLLFFGSSPDKITHTGMYLGSGEFIHATAHERPVIQISRLADEHWTKLLVAVRRPK